mmetsp:Transcript_24151/g.37094  ORF Transcript_24151/g.37094 Transcript_24151/m.37094 type:complete len:278 (-) Transcript_24151:15-848(-)
MAIDIVTKARDILDLSPVGIEDLTSVRPIAIEEGQSCLIEQDLVDKTNENSCLISYYEVGPADDNLGLKMTNEVLMQFMSEPFFNDLRTKQQLGYVVFSRPLNTRDVLGTQFMVQSAKRSCEFMVDCVNQFLVEIREHVKNLSDEEFDIQKQAVMVKLSEKDFNLQQESTRFWGEICTHKYNFDRQQDEIDALSKITKQQFQDLFEKTFFSKESKRIDLQLTSEHHAAEQEEYRTKNAEHPIFKDVLQRQDAYQSIAKFKKEQGLHPDVYKAAMSKY